MTIQTLLEWQNLVFVCPMVLALLFLGLSLLGFGGDHDADVDLDHDIDIGGLDHDIDADLNHDADLDGGGDFPIIQVMLSALGIGRIPMSILIFCWLMIFGFAGLSINLVWEGIFGSIHVLVMISAAVALTISLITTSFLAKIMSKIMPLSNNDSESIANFITREAEVRYTITSDSGTITLNDKFGNLQSLSARCESTDSILPGTKVVILSYSKDKKEFIVTPKNELEVN